MTTFDPSRRAAWAALACGLVLFAGRAHAQNTPPGAAPPVAPGAAPPVAPGAVLPPGDAGAPPSADAAPAAPVPAVPEYDPNLVTQDDLQGLRTDLENFKFQWQREQDLHTARTTRGLLIGGVVQTRVGWTDQPVSSPTVKDRRVTFNIGAALLSFNGSLYRDYEEGRNLTYQLRFGASPQQATNNSFLNLLDAQISYSPVPTRSARKSPPS